MNAKDIQTTMVQVFQSHDFGLSHCLDLAGWPGDKISNGLAACLRVQYIFEIGNTALDGQQNLT